MLNRIQGAFFPHILTSRSYAAVLLKRREGSVEEKSQRSTETSSSDSSSSSSSDSSSSDEDEDGRYGDVAQAEEGGRQSVYH